MKTCLVTGANQGIGYEIAKLLIASNFRVVLGCRDAAKAAEAAAKLMAETSCDPSRLMTLPINLSSDGRGVNAASAAALAAQLGDRGLDVLINNAGFAFKSNAAEPFQHQARVSLDVNYYGSIDVTEKFLPLLLKTEANGGQPARVINVSSRSGILSRLKDEELRLKFVKARTVEAIDVLAELFVDVCGKQSQADNPMCSSAYGFSKACLSAATRAYAEKYKGKLFFAAVCPGWCRTAMAGDDAPNSAASGADVETWIATMPVDELAGLTSGAFYAERTRISYETGSLM
jgi:carbonyl reductase 1